MSPVVGVAGYTLGGGLSWFGRRHGWAADGVTTLEFGLYPVPRLYAGGSGDG
ncbi:MULTISPECIES: hypothetical protein [unclassified Nocardiopsis]|uniref:hypothetical protein n=1 Tax=unclassified Nocardiopsis TaxID=2649073 RepID=UPI001F5BEF96|nr:hypothetical protein [Nocardiopsis sp. TSRI0078]